MSLSAEVIFVGVLVVVIGLVLHMVGSYFQRHDMNNMWVYTSHLFAIGVLTHLICEGSGLNKYYCKNGVACQKQNF